MEPKIREIKKWYADIVQAECIRNQLYTRGDFEEYGHMLDTVASSAPTTESIYRVAQDILQHSEDQTITNIMFILANHAVTTFYEIEEDEK